MKKLELMIVTALIAATTAQAATLALWENDNVVTSINSTPVDFVDVDMSASDLGMGAIGVPGDNWVNALTGYADDLVATTLASAITQSRYFTFTVTPNLGKQADYSNIFVRFTLNDDNAQGASIQFVLMSSETGFTDGDEIGSFTASTLAGAVTISTNNYDVSGFSALQDQPNPVEFRLYAVLAGGDYSRMAIGNAGFINGTDDLRVDGTVEEAVTLPIIKLASWENDGLTIETNNAAAFVETGVSAGDLAQSYRWFNGLAPWPNSMWALCSDLGNVTNLSTAIFEDRYFNLFLEPDAGKQVDYTKVSVRITMNSAGAMGSSATFVLMSNITGFNDGDEIGSFVAIHDVPADAAGATDNGLIEMDISGVAALQDVAGEVEFRVYLILNDGTSNRWGIGHIFGGAGDGLDDVVVNGRLEDAPFTPATILSWTSVSDTVMKLVIDAPSAPSLYYPKGTENLILGFGDVAHSNTNTGPFEITNLTYSATEGDNKVIYVETTADEKFFGIGGE